MDQAKACALHQGNACAQCAQQAYSRALLDGFLEVKVAKIEICAVEICQVEELVCLIEEEDSAQESQRQEDFKQVESPLVLKDERSS